MNALKRIYYIVQQIPKGKVSTYQRVSILAQVRSPRFVGNALHKNPDGDLTPCHRVVNAAGKIAATYTFGGGVIQQKLLEKEGVKFIKHKVDFANHLWHPNSDQIKKFDQYFLYNNYNRSES